MRKTPTVKPIDQPGMRAILRTGTIQFHPILFAIFPVLSLYGANAAQLRFQRIFPVLLVAIAFAIVVWLVALYLTKDMLKGSAAGSIIIILSLSFGHVIQSTTWLLASTGIISSLIGLVRGQLSDVIWLAAYVVGGATVLWLLWRSKGLAGPINKGLTFISLVVVLTAVGQIAIGEISKPRTSVGNFVKQWNAGQVIEAISAASSSAAILPDIYYIVPDSFGSAKAFSEYLDYDNSEFIGYLENKGFYVADESSANYAWTELSLTSSLNLDYLDILPEYLGEETSDTLPLEVMADRNRLFEFLKSRGYLINVFADEYELTDIGSAENYITPQGWVVDAFQNLFLNTTPIPAALRLLSLTPAYDFHREHALFMFDRLSEFESGSRPQFILAHFMVPHPPFVFGPNGERVGEDQSIYFDGGLVLITGETRADYIKGYVGQTEYVSDRLEQVVDAILTDRDRPVIIVIQGDHGPASLMHPLSLEDTDVRERMPILNAYYFSDGDYSGLYEDISPVNTFRLILNQYLGTELALLPDKHYFTILNQPYRFIDITDKLSAE